MKNYRQNCAVCINQNGEPEFLIIDPKINRRDKKNKLLDTLSKVYEESINKLFLHSTEEFSKQTGIPLKYVRGETNEQNSNHQP